MPDTKRYDGRPLLRLLECYVLLAIDALDERARAALVEMEPRLRKIYRVDGTWDAILASVMQMPADTLARIRELWRRNQDIAKSRSEGLTPQQFAEMFVDTNFVPDSSAEDRTRRS